MRILTESKQNFLKKKLKDYEFKFNLNFKNRNKIISFNRLINNTNSKIENVKKNTNKNKIRINQYQYHSHYNIGICLTEYNLDDKNNASFHLDSKKEHKKEAKKEDYNKKKKNILFTKNQNDNLINFIKSKTLYNLSNRENMNIRKFFTDNSDKNIKGIKKNNSLYVQRKNNINNYADLESIKLDKKINIKENKNLSKDKKIALIIGNRLSTLDNIIYSKKMKMKINKKEYTTLDKNTSVKNNKKIKNFIIDLKKDVIFKLPLTKRIKMYLYF